MARPHTFPENFHQLGRSLCVRMDINARLDEATAYRQWLDEAPANAQIQDLSSWGAIMHSVSNNFNTHPQTKEQDARRLGEYFSAFIRLAGKKWKHAGQQDDKNVCNYYAAFHDLVRDVSSQAAGRSNPVFQELLRQQWSPDPLLKKLSELQDVFETNSWRKVHDTSTNALFRILWPLMHDTDWRPSDNGLYACMLSVNEIDASLHESQCAATFSKCVPSQNAWVLHKLLQSTCIAPESISSFFPIDVSSCDAYSILNTFVGLLTEGGRDDPTYKALIVEQQLRMHHPELASLLNMHLTLFSEASEVKSFAEVLVPGFDALYGRDVNPAEVIIGDFFDDDNDNAMGSGAFK